MDDVPFALLKEHSIVLENETFRSEGPEPHHPLTRSIVRQLDDSAQKNLSALRERITESDLNPVGYRYPLWQDSSSPRLVALSPKPNGDEVVFTVKRLYQTPEDPCPFMEKDSQAWSQLLTMLEAHRGSDDPLFHQVRAFRWTGVHLELDGTTPRFAQPKISRQKHPDIQTPWESTAWETAHEWFLGPLEQQIEAMELTWPPGADGNP